MYWLRDVIKGEDRKLEMDWNKGRASYGWKKGALTRDSSSCQQIAGGDVKRF